jgi:ATP-dependent Clp protease adaptor protein ClpS
MAKNPVAATVLKPSETQVKPPHVTRSSCTTTITRRWNSCVEVIQLFFALPRERATQIMLKVHTEGRGVCGIYPKDVALTKVEQVTSYSRQHQHPLQCAMEET